MNDEATVRRAADDLSAAGGRAVMGRACTTCGACEETCPVTIEYIDKIVDLRRGMVDEGIVPQSLQKPLRALEKRGNPWGNVEKKRSAWVKAIAEECPVRLFEKGEEADTLYFVDSISSYDDRMQAIAQATSRTLGAAGVDFGILGKAEKDSGHEVRRFGEEMLFQDLREQNTEAIQESGARQIVTADPHAYNCLKNDYRDLPPVRWARLLWRPAAAGALMGLSGALLYPVNVLLATAAALGVYAAALWLLGIAREPDMEVVRELIPGLNRLRGLVPVQKS